MGLWVQRGQCVSYQLKIKQNKKFPRNQKGLIHLSIECSIDEFSKKKKLKFSWTKNVYMRKETGGGSFLTSRIGIKFNHPK